MFKVTMTAGFEGRKSQPPVVGPGSKHLLGHSMTDDSIGLST
jgi:hypothetical protein